MKAFTETVKSFFGLFQCQASSVTKVYKYIHYMSRKYSTVYLCLDTIARATGFCKRQVQRAIEKLIELGWLGKKIRKRQSSIFFIPDELKKIDISNKKTFENLNPKNPFYEEKCPLNVHPSIKSYFGNESLDREKTRDFSNEEKKEKQSVKIKDILKPIPESRLSEEEKIRLSRDFSEFELQEAFYRTQRAAKALNSPGFKWIKNVCAYFTSTCKCIRGEENARKAFYQT